MAKYCGKDFLIKRGYLVDGAWVTLTAYVEGDVVSKSSQVYVATTSGTSGATGPTGTTPSQTDGTVVWAYVGPLDGSYGFKTIGGMRSNSMSINNEQVDVTDKGDTPWRQLLQCGIRSMEMSGSGIFSDNDVITKMVQDAIDGAIVQLKLISGRGDSFQGDFLVATCERNGEYNGAEQFSLSFPSAGTIAYTPAP